MIPGGSIAGEQRWRDERIVGAVARAQAAGEDSFPFFFFFSFSFSLQVSRRTRHLEHVATTLAGT